MELQIPCIMHQKKLCFIAVCGNRFNTGEGSENFISRFRICFPVWWNCGPFPLSTSYSLSVAGCFAVLPQLFSGRFLKIAWDLREPSGCCAENWEQLGVGFCVSPTLSWTYCCSACWPAAEVGGSSSMIHAILPLYIGTFPFKKKSCHHWTNYWCCYLKCCWHCLGVPFAWGIWFMTRSICSGLLIAQIIFP